MTTSSIKSAVTSGLWRNRSFLILISTAVFLELGNTVYNLALPLLVFDMTHSSEWMGWMRAVEFLPNLVLALFIGIWVDRFNRKHWAVAMIASQIVLLLLAFALLRWQVANVWILLPVAFVINACFYGYGNARMGILKHAIPHEHMNLATARMGSVANLFNTVGPTISGLLLLVAALYWSFLWVALLFVVALFIFTGLPWQPEQAARQHPPVFKALQQGWHELQRNRPLWLISCMVVFINTTGSVFEIQIIYAAKALYQLNSAQIGIMASLGGIGGFVGSMAAPYLRQRLGLGVSMLVAVLLQGLCFVIPVLIQRTEALYLTLFLVEWFSVTSSICIWSYRQESTSAEFIGRVSGLTGSIFKLGMPFGLALSGYVVSSFGVTRLFILCAVVQVAVALISWVSAIRHLD